MPERDELPERLETVLHAIYLVFNEGYSAPAGGADLATEAIRLGRLLVALLPEPEAMGLLALMLLNESRRGGTDTRRRATWCCIADQDRRSGTARMIAEGDGSRGKRARGPVGPFAVQAAIAAVHAEARDAGGRPTGRAIVRLVRRADAR